MEVTEPCIAGLEVEVFLYHIFDKTMRHKIISRTSFCEIWGPYIGVDDLNRLVYDTM